MKPRPKQLVKKTSASGSKPSSAESNASRPASTTPTSSLAAVGETQAPGELGSTITLQMQALGETLLVRWKVVYSGPVYFADGRYLGLIQLEPAHATVENPAVDLWLGDTNGTVDGMQYFSCPQASHGLMLSFEMWLQQQVIPPIQSRPSSAKSLRDAPSDNGSVLDNGSGRFVAVGGVNALLNMRRSGSFQVAGSSRSPLSVTFCDASTQAGDAAGTTGVAVDTQTDPLPLIPPDVQCNAEAMLQHLARIADLVCSRLTTAIEHDETVVQTAAAAQQLQSALSDVPQLFQVVQDLDVDCVDVLTQLGKAIDIKVSGAGVGAGGSSPKHRRDGGDSVEEEQRGGLFQQLLRKKQLSLPNDPTTNDNSVAFRHANFIQRTLSKLASAAEDVGSSRDVATSKRASASSRLSKLASGDDDDNDEEENDFFFGARNGDLFEQFPSFVKDYIKQLRGAVLQQATQRVTCNIFDPLVEYLRNNVVGESDLREESPSAPRVGQLPPHVQHYIEIRVHTEERIRRLLFSIAELTKQIEIEAAEGNVDALESLAMQKVELAQAAQEASAQLLAIFEPVKVAYCEKPLESFKLLAKRFMDFVSGDLSKACREESRFMESKMLALEDSVKGLQDKMVRDNFRLNKDLGEVCSKYANNMQQQLDLAADIAALIKRLAEAEQEARVIAADITSAFLRKERVVKENCAKGVVRCVERSALLAMSRVREWAEDHCAALRQQLGAIAEDEMAALMAVQRTIFEHHSAAHELHLECYRQVCMCSGELQWKKEQALKSIENKLVRANAELEIALDSLSPDAKQLAQIRNVLQETQVTMGQQVLQICAVANEGEQKFMELTGRPLLLAGRTFKDPREEVRLFIESKTNRLKMIADAGSLDTDTSSA